MAEKPKCSVCGAEAKVFVSFVEGDVVHYAAFCQKHAEEAGVLDPQGYALLPISGVTTQHKPAGPASKSCPQCGFTKRDFERRGRLGCPTCYQTFQKEVSPVIGKLQRGHTHFGKIPQRHRQGQVLRARLEHLDGQLKEAVRDERYEEAARLRDSIAALKADLAL